MSEKEIHIDTVVGSVFGNVKQEIHNHYGRKAAHGGGQSDFIEDAEIVEAPEKRPSFEEAIPEYLRTGRLMVAWVKLKEDGFLDEDYHLAEGTPKGAAKRIVELFDERFEKGKRWTIFEKFWGQKNLRMYDGTLSKDTDDMLLKIFMGI